MRVSNGEIEKLCKELTDEEADQVLSLPVVQEYIRKYNGKKGVNGNGT
jgi:hypothetical protein